MAAVKKSDLKDVFIGLSQIMVKKGGIDDFTTVSPELEIPVTVDSLTLSMGEATLNRVKVHGLQADWAVTTTPGEFEFTCTIPSVDDVLMAYFFGNEQGEVTQIASATINGVTGYKGFSITAKNVSRDLGLILINEGEDKAVLFKKMTVTAAIAFENGSTTPLGINLTGTMVAAEGESTDDIAFLTKA
jgi:hypothetical protein